MQTLKLFIDTHDRNNGTFPVGLEPAQFEDFFSQYEQACQAEGVIPMGTHVGYEDGRAYCLNLAPDAESIRRAHERVGLPFDQVTEVEIASPTSTFFRRSA
jgi:hypothetical protein